MAILKTIVAGAILFYSNGQAFDIFSNTSHVPVRLELNSQVFEARSTEALFQGMKGIGVPNRSVAAKKLIQDKSSSLSLLREKANQLGFNSYGNQEIYNQPYQNIGSMGNIGNVGNIGIQVKEEVMYELLLAKATQYPEIAKALLETGQAEIIENTFINKKYNDEFWGNGHSGKGRNALGKAWMRVRDTLRKEIASGGIRVRQGISDDLAQTLGLTQHRMGSQYSGKIITMANLATTKSCTTVAALQKQQRLKNSHSNHATHHHSDFVSHPKKGSAYERVLKATGAESLAMTDDINIPHQKILKLKFHSIKRAEHFAAQSGHALRKDKIVFIGPKRAKEVFKRLHIEVQGKTAKRPMWDALVWESGSLYSL